MSETTATPRARRPWPVGWFVVLLLAAIALRLAVIWWPPETMYEKDIAPHEEILRGNATRDLLGGTLMPLLDYQVNHFWGGSLVVSILAVPWFAFFGETLAVLRMTSLFFTVLSIVCAFGVLDRWIGRRAAWAGAALLAFAPPGYVYLSCTLYGTHLEGNAIALALVWMYLAWRDAGRARFLRTLLFGAAAGFALWFGYTLGILLAVVVGLEFAADKLFFARRWALVFALGFVIGFSPWLVYHWTHHTPAVGAIYDLSIAGHFALGISRGTALEKLYDLLVVDAADALWLHPAWGRFGMAVAQAFFVAIASAVAFTVWTARAELARFARALVRRREDAVPSPRTLAVGFLVLYVASYLLTDFPYDGGDWVFGIRYLAPPWPFAALLCACALQTLAARGHTRFATGALVLACATFVLAALLPCRPSQFERSRTEPGVSDMLHARTIVQLYGGKSELMMNVLERLQRTSPDMQARMVPLLAQGMTYMGTWKSRNLDEEQRTQAFANTLLVLSHIAPEPYRAHFVAIPGWVPPHER